MKNISRIDKITREFLEWDYVSDSFTPNPEELWVEIDPPEGFFSPVLSKDNKWIETASEIIRYGFHSIEEARESKDNLLNKKCEEAILNGFSHIVSGVKYNFSYDKEAQVNLQETYQLFQNNALQHVMWTAKVNAGKVRIPLTKETFNELYYASVRHKLATISYYRDVLLPKLGVAKTVSELEDLVWEDDITIDIGVDIKTDDTIENRLESSVISQSQGDMELFNLILMGMM